jgi:hypothetical protein
MENVRLTIGDRRFDDDEDDDDDDDGVVAPVIVGWLTLILSFLTTMNDDDVSFCDKESVSV